ncbi:MAG: helix-turn-helix transcriptional regulator [Oscillospiraceae bacterium]|nr:helix-turn-helix transcriptional regulator [Oscillospiraceae bacterium]
MEYFMQENDQTYSVYRSGGSKIVCYPIVEGVSLFCVHIQDAACPELNNPDARAAGSVKLNICLNGRCEIKTYSGVVTYLIGGELAVDDGQTMESYTFPTADYTGIELYIEDQAVIKAFSGIFPLPLSDRTHPLIAAADPMVLQITEQILRYSEQDFDSSILRLKYEELLLLLKHLHTDFKLQSRRYYPHQQTEIAKAVHDSIVSDLSVRHSAAELAVQFGVSETSMKTYFRNVYGYSFREFQQKMRMEKAVELLVQTSDSLCQIARQVGFSGQSKFTDAFRKYAGCTPMEYRKKQNKLNK